MTRRLLCAVGLAALVAGCSGGSGSANNPPTDFYGTWKLTGVRGGNTGTGVNYREVLTFRTDNTVTFQINDNDPVTGPFTTERKVTDIQSQPLLVLTLPGGIERAILAKTATTMTLAETNTSNRRLFDYARQ